MRYLLELYDRCDQSRKAGGLGKMNIPLLADVTHSLSKDYGVYLEGEGCSLRSAYMIWKSLDNM